MSDDIKDIHLPVEFPWWGWVLIALATAAVLGVLLWWWFKRPKQNKEIVYPKQPPRPAAEIALEKLEALKQKAYPQLGMFKDFYIGLSDIVRHYLEDRFCIRAPEMTTEEFLVFAQQSPLLNDTQKTFLKDFLNGCDMVKFAQHQPSVSEAQANFDLANRLVLETRDGV